MSRSVLVVGAGPVGVLLTLLLRRRGVDVEIVDREPTQTRESRAITIQPRTLELLEPFGLAEPLIARGMKVRFLRVLDQGDEIARLDSASIRSRFPFLLQLPQSATEAVFREQLEDLVIQRRDVTELDPDPDRLTIGCDGARSTVRTLAGIDFPGYGVPQRFIMVDVVGALQGAAPDERLTFLGPNGSFLIALPVGDGTLRLVSALEEDREPTLEDFLAAGRVTKAPPIEVTEVRWLTRFHPRFHLAETFHRGNVVLAGDAAHVQSPMGAQGMNTGLADAVELAASLDKLDAYSATRRRAAMRVLDEASRRTRAIVSNARRAQWLLRNLPWFGRQFLEVSAGVSPISR